MTSFDSLELGYDIPACPGMPAAEIQTPALVIDLDALERNIVKMGDYVRAHGMRHRVHGKMHKSIDVARLQERLGGAAGICCQKVSEAEVFARGGIGDILISNQVRDAAKIDRLARLPRFGAAITVCVDDIDNVAELSSAVMRHETEIGVLVELDCGAERCGVTTPAEVVALAKATKAALGLRFCGLQAYHGEMQHIAHFADRQAASDIVIDKVRATIDALRDAGLPPGIVSGGGTGSYRFETGSGLFNELQCGSYAFMDADYGRVLDADGNRLDEGEWENAFFVATQVMSHTRPHRAIVDAGLKSLAVDSGLPVVFGHDDLTFIRCSDEHGIISDANGALAVGDRLWLVPGHCDPTVNLHDWYVGVRGGRVETLWPVSARGKSF